MEACAGQGIKPGPFGEAQVPQLESRSVASGHGQRRDAHIRRRHDGVRALAADGERDRAAARAEVEDGWPLDAGRLRRARARRRVPFRVAAPARPASPRARTTRTRAVRSVTTGSPASRRRASDSSANISSGASVLAGFAASAGRAAPRTWATRSSASSAADGDAASSRSRSAASTLATRVDPARPALRPGVPAPSLDHLIEVAVHDVVEPVQRELDAMVRQAALRKVVGPDALGTMAGARLGAGAFPPSPRRAARVLRTGASRAAEPSRAHGFLCWERSSWHSTTIPVGRCVTRTAESVLLTCWPPAPEER